MPLYKVVDARRNMPFAPQVTVNTDTPEEAAQSVLGIDLVHSGRHADLAARVYWADEGQPMNMVRLYIKVADAQQDQAWSA